MIKNSRNELDMYFNLIEIFNDTQNPAFNFLNENTSPGDIIELTVIRGNENLILDVKLGARPLIN